MEKQIPAPKFEMHPDMLTEAEIDARLAELGWGILSFLILEILESRKEVQMGWN